MACRSCGQQTSNPKQAPVVGPAAILGNGAVMPFPSDDALDRWIAWKADRGETRIRRVGEGETA